MAFLVETPSAEYLQVKIVGKLEEKALGTEPPAEEASEKES